MQARSALSDANRMFVANSRCWPTLAGHRLVQPPRLIRTRLVTHSNGQPSPSPTPKFRPPGSVQTMRQYESFSLSTPNIQRPTPGFGGMATGRERTCLCFPSIDGDLVLRPPRLVASLAPSPSGQCVRRRGSRARHLFATDRSPKPTALRQRARSAGLPSHRGQEPLRQLVAAPGDRACVARHAGHNP